MTMMTHAPTRPALPAEQLLSVRGWSLALTLGAIAGWLARIPREAAAEVSAAIARTTPTPVVRLHISPARWAAGADAVMLLRWRTLLDGQVHVDDPARWYRGRLVEFTARGTVDGVDVAAVRTIEVDELAAARLQEDPQRAYAILTELATRPTP